MSVRYTKKQLKALALNGVVVEQHTAPPAPKRSKASKEKTIKEPSKLEIAFDQAWMLHKDGMPDPVCELRFAPPRKWRFDRAWPDAKIAVEIDGGTWMGGRHSRGEGYSNDCEKLNHAVLMGWRVLRYTSDMIKKDPAGVIAEICEVLQQFGG